MQKMREGSFDNEFDEFISIPINNKFYEEIRKFCIHLNEYGNFQNNASENEKKRFESYLLELKNRI